MFYGSEMEAQTAALKQQHADDKREFNEKLLLLQIQCDEFEADKQQLQYKVSELLADLEMKHEQKRRGKWLNPSYSN